MIVCGVRNAELHYRLCRRGRDSGHWGSGPKSRPGTRRCRVHDRLRTDLNGSSPGEQMVQLKPRVERSTRARRR